MQPTNVALSSSGATGPDTSVLQFTGDLQVTSMAVPSTTSMSANDGPADIHDFLQRPVHIATISWTSTGILTDDFDPWALFIANAAVTAKTHNYNHLRAKAMHLRFVMDGSAFHYGMIHLAYWPGYASTKVALGNAGGGAGLRMTAYSIQLPHIEMVPSDNTAGELVIPFHPQTGKILIAKDNHSDIHGRVLGFPVVPLRHATLAAPPTISIQVYAWLEQPKFTSPTPFVASAGVGILGLGTRARPYRLSIQRLCDTVPSDVFHALLLHLHYPLAEDSVLYGRHVHRGPINVAYTADDSGLDADTDLSVPIWHAVYPTTYASEVVKLLNNPHSYLLFSNTSVLQHYTSFIASGKSSRGTAIQHKASPKTEYGAGPISYPASIAAAAGRAISSIPVLKPLGVAVDIGGRLLATVAGIFGLSRPPNVETPMTVTLTTTDSLSSTTGSTLSRKLAVDPKNEVALYPAAVGLSSTGDQLSIASLVQREGYLHNEVWTTAHTAGTILDYIPVHPTLVNTVSATAQILELGSYKCTNTPLNHVSSMFSYWTGSLVYRIRVPRAAVIRGRLRIAWIPPTDLTVFPTEALDNTSYNTILDLSEADEIEFIVPYEASMPWLPIYDPQGMNQITGYTPGHLNYNGNLVLQVVNPLIGSLASFSVDIFVTVRAGADFRLAIPNMQNLQRFSMRLNYVDEGALAVDTSLVYNAFVASSGPSTYGPPFQLDTTHFEEIHMGESIRSLRALFKRSVAYLSGTIQAGCGLIAAEADNLENWHVISPPSKVEDYYAYYNGTYRRSMPDVETDAYHNLAAAVFHQTFMTWMQPCYHAVRGSLRWTLHIDRQSTHSTSRQQDSFALWAGLTKGVDSALVTTTNGGLSVNNPRTMVSFVAPTGNINSSPGATVVYGASQDANFGPNSWLHAISSGATEVTHSQHSSAIQIEVPYYCPLLFKRGDNDATEQGLIDTLADINADLRPVFLYMPTEVSTTVDITSTPFELLLSAGEDYDLNFFVVAPSFYFISEEAGIGRLHDMPRHRLFWATNATGGLNNVW